jgi:hypothetical protein
LAATAPAAAVRMSVKNPSSWKMVSSSPVALLKTRTTPLLDGRPRSGFFQKPVAILTVKVEPCFKYPYLMWQSPGGFSKSS